MVGSVNSNADLLVNAQKMGDLLKNISAKNMAADQKILRLDVAEQVQSVQSENLGHALDLFV